MKSEDIIRYRGDLSVVEDVFNMLCGACLGEGASRAVYEYMLDSKYVVKIAITPDGIVSNSNEYSIWNYYSKSDNKIKDWLTPIKYISPNGNILIMRKTKEMPGKERPKKIPKIFSDNHYYNFGWLGDKFVCHDYGQLKGFLK